MIRIYLPYMWALREELDFLAHLNEAEERDKFALALNLLGPENTLRMLLENSVFSHTLRSSRPLAAQLLKLISAETDNMVSMEGTADRHTIWAIKQAFDQFKTAFIAELGTLPGYFVTQKGDRDTLTLLDQPWRMFPDDLAVKVPEASYDVAEAGKALCFEVATACGYHVFRATEAVLRRYYSHVTNGKAHPKMRNIMVYVRAIRDAKCGDERILSVLEQMSKLHRNPIAHPEVALTLDEAMSTLGMARSVITVMLSALPVPPQTTGATGAS